MECGCVRLRPVMDSHRPLAQCRRASTAGRDRCIIGSATMRDPLPLVCESRPGGWLRLILANGGVCELQLSLGGEGRLRAGGAGTAWRFVQGVADWLMVSPGPPPSEVQVQTCSGAMRWCHQGREDPFERTPFRGCAKLWFNWEGEFYFERDERRASLGEKDPAFRGELVRGFRGALVGSVPGGVGDPVSLSPARAEEELLEILDDGEHAHELAAALAQLDVPLAIVRPQLTDRGRRRAQLIGLLACLGELDAPLELRNDEPSWLECIHFIMHCDLGVTFLDRHRAVVIASLEQALPESRSLYATALIYTLARVDWGKLVVADLVDHPIKGEAARRALDQAADGS